MSLVRVRVRRWASEQSHRAWVLSDEIERGVFFGSSAEFVTPPVAAMCGAKLRGNGLDGSVGNTCIVLPEDSNFRLCKTCEVLNRDSTPKRQA